MKKFEFNNINKKALIVVEYILCLMLIEAIIILVNVRANNKSVETNVLTSVSQVNSNAIADKESIGNFKVIENQKDSYYIKINCLAQLVTVYVSDEDGNYVIPIKKMICSTGTSTPNSGIYSLSDRYEWGSLVGNVYGQYCTRITGPILFHSVPYTKRDNSSLEYWEYDKLGQPVSKGCVRLTVEDAKWIYENCKFGTKVEFYEGEEETNTIKQKIPMKISDYSEELRGWDPTDPDERNPWTEYIKQNEGEIE